MVDGNTAPERAIGADALKAFAHPLRMAMYAALRNDGPATASILGRALGESSGQTSYHLRQLERHGFVEDDPDHAGGRERWWRAVGFAMDSADLLADPGTAPAAQALLHAVVAERTQTMSTWVDELSHDLSWEAQAAMNSTLRLTQDEAADLIARTRAVVEAVERESAERESAERAAAEHGSAGVEGDDAGRRRRIRVYVDVFPLPPERDGS